MMIIEFRPQLKLSGLGLFCWDAGRVKLDQTLVTLNLPTNLYLLPHFDRPLVSPHLLIERLLVSPWDHYLYPIFSQTLPISPLFLSSCLPFCAFVGISMAHRVCLISENIY